MICLDTTYFVDWIVDSSRIVTITKRLEGRNVLATTAFNVFEILSSTHMMGDDSVLEKVVDKLERGLVPIEALPFGVEDAKKAAEIMGNLRKKGFEVGGDAMTAAVALNKGCDGIVSRNTFHFREIEQVTGLKLIEY